MVMMIQWHEFEDGRAERAADDNTGCADTTGVTCEFMGY